MPLPSRPKKTAIVKVAGYCTLEGNCQYSVDWGFKDHPNNFTAVVPDIFDEHIAELHAARQAIKKAKKQKYTKIRILTASLYVWDWIKNSANFAKAAPEVVRLVQSIHAYKEHLRVQVEHIGNENGTELAGQGEKENR